MVNVEQHNTETKVEKIIPVALVVDHESQAIVARDNSELLRLIRTMMKGQAFPKQFTTEEQLISCWQVAASLKVPPAVAIQNMCIINGSVSIWGQLPKALAEATGELEDFQLILIDKDHKIISLENKNLGEEVWGAICKIKRKGRTLNEYSFTMREAESAGLLNKAGPWKTFQKLMLSRRAVGHAIKFEFPDAVMGVGISEYDHHQAPDLEPIRDVGPSMAAKNNAKFKTIVDREVMQGDNA